MKVFIKAIAAVALGSTIQVSQAQSNATVAPPPEVTNMISIDAHNAILIETQNQQEANAPKQYSWAVPQHVYSGGIVRAMGGNVMPTELFVVPGAARRMGANPNDVNSFAGNNSGGIGSTSGWPGGFQNGIGQNAGGNNFNSFSRFNAPLPVNNMQQFNQVMSYLDRPMVQAQVGVSFGNTGEVNNRGAGISFGKR